MPDLPKLMPTSAQGESFANVTYHLDGELVPALTIDVSQSSVYFEHNILLWKHPQVQVRLKPMKGALKRMIAGMQVFTIEAGGPGMISFSRDGAGHIVPLHMQPGQEIHVREHQFLAATEYVDYTFERVKGFANVMAGDSGFFIDKFQSHAGPGILWVHGYGNVFEKYLQPGEQIDIEPGGWLYKDSTVHMETIFDKLTSGLFGGMNFIVNRFTGPGRIAIQSMYMPVVSGS